MSSLETISFLKHTQSFTQESYVMIVQLHRYEALDAACRSLIHRVDITYVISLNAVYVQTFGIRFPNIKGKY